MVAKGYLTKLLANPAVKSYIERKEPEILSHLELVANTVSMEEAVQQLCRLVLAGSWACSAAQDTLLAALSASGAPRSCSICPKP